MRKTLTLLVAILALVVGVSAGQRQFNKHSSLIATFSETKRSGLEGIGAEVIVCGAVKCETEFTNSKGAANFSLLVTETDIEVTVIPIDPELCPWSATLKLSGVVENGFINHYVLLGDCEANTP